MLHTIKTQNYAMHQNYAYNLYTFQKQSSPGLATKKKMTFFEALKKDEALLSGRAPEKITFLGASLIIKGKKNLVWNLCQYDPTPDDNSTLC